MSRIKNARPSPAMLVAITALVAGLGGSAIGQVATKALSKRDVRRVRRIARFQANRQIRRRTPGIANNRITARAPGLSVADAVNAINAQNADTASQADNADAVDHVSAFEVDLTMAEDGPMQSVDVGPFKVNLTCDGGNLVANADSDVSGAFSSANGMLLKVSTAQSLAIDFSNDFKATAFDPDLSLSWGGSGIGTLVVRTSSTVTGGSTNYTLDYHYREANGCSINGNGLIS